MNRIIWVFGCSASGKETFIHNIINNNVPNIEKQLGIDYKSTFVIDKSISLISLNRNDSIDIKRYEIIDTYKIMIERNMYKKKEVEEV